MIGRVALQYFGVFMVVIYCTCGLKGVAAILVGCGEPHRKKKYKTDKDKIEVT